MYRLRAHAGHSNRLIKYLHSVLDRLFRDSERRTDLDRCAAKTERRKKQKAANEALIDDLRCCLAVGFVAGGPCYVKSGHETFAMNGANIGMIEFGQFGVQRLTYAFSSFDEMVLINNLEAGERCCATDGISGMCTGHVARDLKVHDIGFADHRRNR